MGRGPSCAVTNQYQVVGMEEEEGGPNVPPLHRIPPPSRMLLPNTLRDSHIINYIYLASFPSRPDTRAKQSRDKLDDDAGGRGVGWDAGKGQERGGRREWREGDRRY